MKNPNNTPFFEINNEVYVIKRNRYLQAEFDLIQKELELSDEEQLAFEKEQDFDERFEKLKNRKDELYAKFLETFDEKDEEIYNKACQAFDKMLEQASEMESIGAQHRKKMLDKSEKLIIKALQIDYNTGEEIRTNEEATNIWQSFVDENGQKLAIEFILYTMHYIVGTDEETENPFIAQAKAKAEQKANMKKGIVKAK